MKEGDSNSEGTNRKHSALMRQPTGERKGRKGKDGKSRPATPRSIDCGESIVCCTLIAAVRTVNNIIAQLNTESPHGAESFADLDTHTNNIGLGGGCLLVHNTGRRVDVSGFEVPSRTTTLSLARFTSWFSTRQFIVAQWQTICYVPCSVGVMTLSSTMSPRSVCATQMILHTPSRSTTRWTRMLNFTSHCCCVG